MQTTLIDRYKVHYSANRFKPRIWFYDEQNKPIEQQLVFWPNGAELPEDDATNIHYHLDDFAHVLDILRNEKPVLLRFAGPGHGNENGIATANEPVGEGEETSVP